MGSEDEGNENEEGIPEALSAAKMTSPPPTPNLPEDCMREITAFMRDDESLAAVSKTCALFKNFAIAHCKTLLEPKHVFDFRLKEGQGRHDDVLDSGSRSGDGKKAMLGGGKIAEYSEHNALPAFLTRKGMLCDGGADDCAMMAMPWGGHDGEIYDLQAGYATIPPIRFGESFSIEVYFVHEVINHEKVSVARVFMRSSSIRFRSNTRSLCSLLAMLTSQID